jgi:hypothetical protein
MRHITLAAASLAALAFAGAAYADSNYGPRQNGNQCWHQQLGNSLGYWSPCGSSQNAQAQRANARATAKTRAVNRQLIGTPYRRRKGTPSSDEFGR